MQKAKRGRPRFNPRHLVKTTSIGLTKKDEDRLIALARLWDEESQSDRGWTNQTLRQCIDIAYKQLFEE
jgi:hypothetical protein